MEALVAAASELFATRGFDGTTVDLIARQSRVNKAMINYHFGGKQGLYETILADTFLALSKRLESLRTPAAPADLQLRQFTEVFAEMAARKPFLPPMLLREALSGGRHLPERVMPHFLSVFVHVREIVQQGIREQTFRPVNPLFTHLALIGSLVFFYATTPFRQRLIAEGKLPAVLPSAEEFVRHVQETTIRGLAASEPDPVGRS